MIKIREIAHSVEPLKKYLPKKVVELIKPYWIKTASYGANQIDGISAGAFINIAKKSTILELPDYNQKSGLFEHILFWVDDADISGKNLAKYLKESRYLPNVTTSAIIEMNPNQIAIMNMYDLIHDANSIINSKKYAATKNLIITINATHNLPYLIRKTWARTKIVGIFENENYLNDYLSNADCIIARDEFMKKINHKDLYPCLLKANEPEAILAQLKAFIQSQNCETSYFFSINEMPIDILLANQLKKKDIVFITKFDIQKNENKHQTFSSFMDELLENSDDIWINSKWIYQMETFVANKNWPTMIKHMLQLGAYIDIKVRP